jgi:hypothetical protein
MAQWIRVITVLVLATATFLPARDAGALQDTDETPPGVMIETVASGPSLTAGEDLVLLRLTLSPDAFIAPGAESTATLLSVESGGAALSLLLGGADVTRRGTATSERVKAGDYVTLDRGDSVAFNNDTRLSIDNPTDTDATYLVAALAPLSRPFLVAHPAGSFSVETYACPAGMTIASLDATACSIATAPLVQWQLSSDQFSPPLGPDEATIDGATMTWEGLPEGTYFVDLTAESLAPGYVDYFIPSSNQITRQDELTTRIYYDAERSRGSVGAFVFAGDGS